MFGIPCGLLNIFACEYSEFIIMVSIMTIYQMLDQDFFDARWRCLRLKS